MDLILLCTVTRINCIFSIENFDDVHHDQRKIYVLFIFRLTRIPEVYTGYLNNEIYLFSKFLRPRSWTYVKWNAIERKLETDRRGYATVNFNCAPAFIHAAIWRVQLPAHDPLSRFCSWHSRRCHSMVCWLVCTCVHVCVPFNSPPGQISLQTIIFLSLSSSIRHCESNQEKPKGSAIPGNEKQLVPGFCN